MNIHLQGELLHAEGRADGQMVRQTWRSLWPLFAIFRKGLKMGTYWQILVKVPKIEFHENASNNYSVVPYGYTYKEGY